MLFKKILQKIYGCCILGFVLGAMFSIFLPPLIIAVIEGIMLIILCFCVYFC